MNLHLVLTLMTLPTFLGSLLTLAIGMEPASALNTRPVDLSSLSQATCDWPAQPDLKSSNVRHPHQGVAIASAGSLSDETDLLNFSEAESDAAAALFGCDCATCINALRQLRSQPLFNNNDGNRAGHCWTSLQRRSSSQKVQEVLQNLEKRESESVR